MQPSTPAVFYFQDSVGWLLVDFFTVFWYNIYIKLNRLCLALGSIPILYNLVCLVKNILLKLFLTKIIESLIDFISKRLEPFGKGSKKNFRRIIFMAISFIMFHLTHL